MPRAGPGTLLDWLAGPARRDLAGPVAGQRRGPARVRVAGGSAPLAGRTRARPGLLARRHVRGAARGGQRRHRAPVHALAARRRRSPPQLRPDAGGGTGSGGLRPAAPSCWTPIPSCRRPSAGSRSTGPPSSSAAKGGALGDVTIGDLLAEHAAEEEALSKPCQGMQVIYGALRVMGVIDGPRDLPPAARRRPAHPRADDRPLSASPASRSGTCSWTTSANASPQLDYSSLDQLGYELGKLFWADMEQHHPGIGASACPTTSPARGSSGSRSRTAPAGLPRQRRADQRPPLPHLRPRLLPRHRPVGAG